MYTENETDSQQPNKHLGSPKANEDRVLQAGVLLKNHIENQGQSDVVENATAFQIVKECNKLLALPTDKSDRLVPPCLVLCDQNTSDVQGAESNGRVRKLSVVSPPVSPASPRDKQNVPWMSDSPQISSKENSSDLLKGCLTPVEALGICPLPLIEPVKVRVAPDVSKPPLKKTNNPALPNGLEGCCGGSVLVDVPSENRVTFSVEIHKQKNVKSTTTDFHGHTETML